MAIPGPKTLREALVAMVSVAGGSRRVAFRIWPDKSPRGAAGRLEQVLRKDGRGKLSAEEWAELFKVGQEVGFHLPMEMLCEEAGYTKPAPVDSEQRKAELQKQFLRVMEDIDGIVSEKTFDEAFAEAEAREDPKWRTLYERRRRFQRNRDELMAQVAERDGAWCRCCGTEKDLSLDHIKPITKDGTDELENLQILCLNCNLRKGDRATVGGGSAIETD